MNIFKKKHTNKNVIIEDVLLTPREDRRKLSYAVDPDNIRNNLDRRGKEDDIDDNVSVEEAMTIQKKGIRYITSFPIKLFCINKKNKKEIINALVTDISATGLQIKVDNKSELNQILNTEMTKLKFRIPAGSMPEGFEMKVSIYAKQVRTFKDEDDNIYVAFQFKEDLTNYSANRKDRLSLMLSSLFMLFIILFIMLMRIESVLYFKFNKILYLYSIMTATFLLSRYLFGALYKAVPVDVEFTPGVTVIIPCFNEEEWIQRTIISCINQDYPTDKLEVIIVDDCSTDSSVEKISEIVEEIHNEHSRFTTKERLSYIVMEKNGGKREALARGALVAKHELVVFVDSDSFLDPYAIRHLVQPFKDPKMGGVSGRTDVANTYTNGLTKMQSVRYYIAFRMMKAAEAYFDSVTCLSGPLACYKKQIILDHREEWLSQKFLGQKATFGDDRSMTNFVLRHHRTSYQDSAICSTIVPNQYKVFLKQQMRWKRSWLRESIIAGSFIWKKEPFMSLFFYIGLLVPILAPIVVLYNLVYVPLTENIFPTTFLIGLLLMAMLMSIVQLFLKKSTTWIYGLYFCLFYEAVLLWQMPIAVITFWKSTWGTRMTPEDIADKDRKEKRKNGKIPKKILNKNSV